jgi:flagellar biosynthesis/type III secretory pathway protein FliH
MEIGFSFKCACCNEILRAELSGQDFYIQQCQKCLKEASDSGFEAGKNKGYSKGYSNGHIQGFDDGQAAVLR